MKDYRFFLILIPCFFLIGIFGCKKEEKKPLAIKKEKINKPPQKTAEPAKKFQVPLDLKKSPPKTPPLVPTETPRLTSPTTPSLVPPVTPPLVSTETPRLTSPTTPSLVPPVTPPLVSTETPTETEEIHIPEAAVTTESPALQKGFVTNVFIDTDIREAINELSTQAGVKVIMDDTVRGLVNIEVIDIPFEEALDQIMLQTGYTYKEYKDYYLIGIPDPKNPTFKYLSTTEKIKLNYIKADKIKKLLPEDLSSCIYVEEGYNTLIVTAPSSLIELIKERIKKIDVKPHRIVIKVLVTEILEKKRKALGVKWMWDGRTIPKAKAELSNILQNISVNVDKNTIAEIWSLAEKGEAKIKANPHISTLEGSPASLSISEEEYYLNPVTIYHARSLLESIKTGIILKVTPYTTEEKEILLSLEPEISDVVEIGREGLPIVSRRSLKTTLVVKNGETIAIGGLLQERKEKKTRGIPGISRVPLLGKLFSHSTTKTYQTELVVFITSYIEE
ncbi:TPA: hypothetical protein DCX16_06650 [bacterium]|nr:hypothetical protein [bacterium]